MSSLSFSSVAALQLLAMATRDDTYSSVLNTLGAGIRAAGKRIGNAERTSPEAADYIADAEVEIIENLLGAAFVVCQVQIAAVTQAALRTRARAVAEGLQFNAFGDSVSAVRAIGQPFSGQYSKIEVLWALANYFKHRDEWSIYTWKQPKGQSAITIPVLHAAGLQATSTGNLRTGAEALGNSSYDDISAFELVIREWAEKVHALTRNAFGV